MKLTDFDYNLPDHKISKFPPEERGSTKLLYIDQTSGELADFMYADLPELLEEGDLVVLNRTKVLKARTYFTSKAGKEHEILVHNIKKDGTFDAIIGRPRKLKIGDRLEDQWGNQVLLNARDEDSPMWNCALVDIEVDSYLRQKGEMPIPPYFGRKAEEIDTTRYNTIFGDQMGSVAAPTASLNVTDELLTRFEERGIKTTKLTLDVGWGTFAPVRSENIAEHKIHEERFSVSEQSVEAINEVKDRGGRVVAVGTTAARALESLKEDSSGKFVQSGGMTDLYITPGYQWRVVDGMVTNFHAPKSSLLMLVAALMGYDKMREVYQYGLDSDYKFLSYGDSMLIL